MLVELTAKQVLGEWKASHTGTFGKISVTLWLTAPVESSRTRLLMLRTGINDAHEARATVGMHAAAREALRLALPDRHGRTVRRIISRQLRAGSLPPAAILAPLGWAEPQPVLTDAQPETILRAVLHGVLDSATLNAFTSPAPSDTSLLEVEAAAVAPSGDTPGRKMGSGDWTYDTKPETPQMLDEAEPIPAGPDTLAGEGGNVLVQVGRLDLRTSRSPSDSTCGVGDTDDRNSHQAEDFTSVVVEHRGPQPGHSIVDVPVTNLKEPFDFAENSLAEDVSTSRRPEVQRRRLNDAIDIVRGSPTITGPELAVELRAKRWRISDRTASRILPAARSEAAALGNAPLALVAANI